MSRVISEHGECMGLVLQVEIFYTSFMCMGPEVEIWELSASGVSVESLEI